MVAGLVLSGAMLTPGRLALGMQKTLIRMLPNQALADSGASKSDLLRALDVIAGADFGTKIGTVEIPALVLAGMLSGKGLLFVAAMLAGMLLYHPLGKWVK